MSDGIQLHGHGLNLSFTICNGAILVQCGSHPSVSLRLLTDKRLYISVFLTLDGLSVVEPLRPDKLCHDISFDIVVAPTHTTYISFIRVYTNSGILKNTYFLSLCFCSLNLVHVAIKQVHFILFQGYKFDIKLYQMCSGIN